MRATAYLIVAALTALVQAPQTPGSVPAESLPPQMSPVVQTCVPCHGARGEGKPAAGFPRIGAQSQYYIRKQLDSYADGSRRDPVMEPIAKGLPPALRAEAAAYYAQAVAPAVSGASLFTHSWVARGRLLANQGDLTIRVQACVNCHGPGGVGEPPALPYVAGLDDGYIRVALNAWREGRRRNDAGEQMAAIAKALRPEDIAAVARYYAGLTPPKPVPLNLVQASQPRLMATGTTPSTTVGSNTPQDKGAGIESRAPRTGGEHGLAAGGARSPGGQNGEAPDASGAMKRGSQTPAGETRPSDEDAARGRALIASGTYGCAACHTIPGIRAPRGIVGPDLGGFSRRPFIAGQLANRSEVLIAFLQNPPALVPATGMPNVGLSVKEARSIAAYLYTLEPSHER
jgi:cytochrome c553/cytochrome c2